MTAGAWPVVAALAFFGGLTGFHEMGGERSAAAPARDAAAARPSPAACARMKRRVERELATAQRCQADDECVAISFEYAFRPCGESVREGASLDEAAAHAKEYVDRCHPVLRPVKCAHKITPVCARGRCALETPPDE